MVVSEGLAEDRGWKVGSTVDAAVGTIKKQSLTVGGIFEDNQVLSAQMVVPRELYLKATPPALQTDFLVYVKAKAGADQPRCAPSWRTR